MLFVALSTLSLHYVLMYQQVLAQDTQEGQLLSQIKINKIEYNSSDPTVIMGTKSGGSFPCNITYENPTNSNCTISNIEVVYDRKGTFEHGIAYGGSPSTILLNSTSLTITINMNYANLTRPPTTNDTIPVFDITTVGRHGSTARELETTFRGGEIENSIARMRFDQTYSVLSSYSTIAATVWVIGLGPAFVVMLFTSKGERQIKRWASFIFLLNFYSGIILAILPHLPLPGPRINYTPTSPEGESIAGGVLNMVTLLALLYGALNLYLFIRLFFQSRLKKTLSYIVLGSVIAVFIFYFLAGLGYWLSNIDFGFLALAVLAGADAITLLRLRQICLNK